MSERGYDFLAWTSFPSSRKMVNETEEQIWWEAEGRPPVEPGRTLTVTVNGRGKDLIMHPVTRLGPSHIAVDGLNAVGEKVARLITLNFPIGTFDWRGFKATATVSSDVVTLRINTIAGPGLPERPSVTWFDDLKIYMDDVLIYQDDFGNWNPYIGAGLGGVGGAIAGYLIKPKEPLVPALVGACLGAVLGGGVGYFTAVPRASSPESPERQVQYATVR